MLYAFLVNYYLEELSDPYLKREIEQAPNQRLFICEQIATWLPWDKHYDQIKAFFEQCRQDELPSCLLIIINHFSQSSLFESG